MSAFIELVRGDRKIHMLGTPTEWVTEATNLGSCGCGHGPKAFGLGACCAACAKAESGMGKLGRKGRKGRKHAKLEDESLSDIKVRSTIQRGLDSAEAALGEATAIFDRLGALKGLEQGSDLAYRVQTIREMIPVGFDLFQALSLESRVSKLEGQAKTLLQAAKNLEAKGGGMSGLYGSPVATDRYDDYTGSAYAVVDDLGSLAKAVADMGMGGRKGGPPPPPPPIQEQEQFIEPFQQQPNMSIQTRPGYPPQAVARNIQQGAYNRLALPSAPGQASRVSADFGPGMSLNLQRNDEDDDEDEDEGGLFGKDAPWWAMPAAIAFGGIMIAVVLKKVAGSRPASPSPA